MVELIEFLKPALFGAPLMTVLYGIVQIWEETPDQSTWADIQRGMHVPRRRHIPV